MAKKQKKTEGNPDRPKAFLDAYGRVWVPKVTARVIEAFEARTGRGLFHAVFEVLKTVPDNKKKKNTITPQVIFSMGQHLFGSVGALMLILYESCRSNGDELPLSVYPENYELQEGDPAEGEPVTFHEFCQGITKSEVGPALQVALKCLFDFFPGAEDGIDSDGGESDGPFGLGDGKMSLNTQLSPE